MKQLFKVLFVFVLMVIAFSSYEAKASSIPYSWLSNGQEISSKYTVNGTATVEKDGYTVTLTLNNYNGGSLATECYGTGVSGVTFNIVLIGNNTITDLSGIGIILNYSGKINFIGDGDLTINALKPINYEDYTDYLYINPSKNIYTNNKNLVVEQPTTSDNPVITDNPKDEDGASANDNESLEDEKDDKTNYTFIIMCLLIGYIAVSMIMFIVLFGKINKLKSGE